MSESIKQAFIKKDSSEPQGFSLLAAFGRKDQDSEDESGLLTEPPHDKTNKMTVRPAKTQISLGIRPV